MFDKSRHYPLKETQWDVTVVQRTIHRIISDAIKCLNPETGWPCHPMDDFSGSNFYMGSAGVFWAIDYLKQECAIETHFEIEPFLEDQLKANREQFKNHPHPDNSSYLFGELPILMLQYKLSKDKSIADEIFQSIQKNNSEPVRELMWGCAGTMIAANLMYQWLSESRWKDVFLIQANRLLEEWKSIPGIGHLWSPELYGENRKYLGPVHGFTGNIIPLIKGRRLLPEEQFEMICSRVMETIVNTAESDQNLANWVAVYDTENPQQKPNMVQHCHGAPGIITALSEMPGNKNDQFDQILEKGGELVWLAGPLKKGSNLCHGTGGNGYAFLKLYERTQNQKWLERARLFAMHSIEQYELSKELYGQGRYSLWTGDVGLAIYLSDCIQAQARFPTIDVF
ncbi:MAG: lanthionine synthetase [Deltaproteobacteria bacterium]|jgi:lantibiotic modifying enzyme|nr:lanthionine synthetase [Deltaproteobacteria bacterium]